MAATDIDDPAMLALQQWARVLSQWMDGEAEPMAAWLLDPGTVLVDDAREFLADLVQGQVKRPRGRRSGRRGSEERAIVAEVYAAREKYERNQRITKAHERGIDAVARRRGMVAEAVRGIVDRLNARGITFENWKRWGRPPFI